MKLILIINVLRISCGVRYLLKCFFGYFFFVYFILKVRIFYDGSFYYCIILDSYVFIIVRFL